jgi:hypothetical protein
MSGEDNPSGAIDGAVERGLLVHQRGSLTFRHELARRAAEEMQAPAKAAALHARILALLEAEHADGELLFWKSQATAVSAPDPRCPKPFRLATGWSAFHFHFSLFTLE